MAINEANKQKLMDEKGIFNDKTDGNNSFNSINFPCGIKVTQIGKKLKIKFPDLKTEEQVKYVARTLEQLLRITPIGFDWALDLEKLERIPIALLGTLMNLRNHLGQRDGLIELFNEDKSYIPQDRIEHLYTLFPRGDS